MKKHLHGIGLVFTFASSSLTSRFVVEVDVAIGHVAAQVEVVLESKPKTTLALDVQLHRITSSIRARSIEHAEGPQRFIWFHWLV